MRNPGRSCGNAALFVAIRCSAEPRRASAQATTIAFAAEYAHWFEVALSNQLPTIAGTIGRGVHMAIFWGWLAARLEDISSGSS